MAKTAQDFGAPNLTAKQDQSKQLKTSQRVAASIVKYSICDEAVEVPVDEIGADPNNRGGATPQHPRDQGKHWAQRLQ